MTEPLLVRPGVVIPAAELSWRFSRSSGPGGQSVNTTDSRVSLSYDVQRGTALPAALRDRALARLGDRLADGVLTVHAERERSQLLNRQAALHRLARLLREATDPPGPRRSPTRPGLGAVERRLKSKQRRGLTKRLRGPVADD